MEFAVTGFIWSEKLKHVEHSCPTDWWQHFKERWFPKWLKERYPVMYTKTVYDMEVLYPDYKPIVEAGKYEFQIRYFSYPID